MVCRESFAARREGPAAVRRSDGAHANMVAVEELGCGQVGRQVGRQAGHGPACMRDDRTKRPRLACLLRRHVQGVSRHVYRDIVASAHGRIMYTPGEMFCAILCEVRSGQERAFGVSPRVFQVDVHIWMEYQKLTRSVSQTPDV